LIPPPPSDHSSCSAARRRLANAWEPSPESGTSHLKHKAPSSMTLNTIYLFLPLAYSHIPQTNMTYPPPHDYSFSDDPFDFHPLNLVFYWEYKAG
jgi:hypothetical protein